MRSFLVGLVLLGGCTSTRQSKLPPFVRDLRPAIGGLEMIQCEIVVTTTTKQNWFFHGSETTRQIDPGQCWNQVVSTEPPAGEVQP